MHGSLRVVRVAASKDYNIRKGFALHLGSQGAGVYGFGFAVFARLLQCS